MNLYEVFKILNIKYIEIEHEPVYTVAEAFKVVDDTLGTCCKNIFLMDKKNKFYLYILPAKEKADLKNLAETLNVKHLSFGSVESLKSIMDLEPGAVTPFGIINDTDNKVTIIIVKSLQNQKLLFPSNINTKTLSLEYNDLIKFIDYLKHNYILH